MIKYSQENESETYNGPLVVRKNIESGINEMSCVGIIRCSDGFLAFADKKSSIVINGRIGEDSLRGKIPKVFANSNLLITTSGNNVVGKKYIEDIIEEVLEKAQTITDFVAEFEKHLLNNFDKRTFEIYLVDKNKDLKTISCLIFENCKLIKTDFGKYYYVNGNKVYLGVLLDFLNNKLENYKVNDLFNIPMRNMKIMLLEKFDNIYGFCCKEMIYNSVSKEFDFIDFQIS